MTTYTQLVLKPRQAFAFTPTLDGQVYNATVTWGLYGQRPYLNVFDQVGVRLLTVPLVGSPDALPIASCVWNELTGTVVVTTQNPHGVPIGCLANLTIAGTVGAAYNGLKQVWAASPATFQYSQATDPGGPSTQQGTIGFLIDLVAGYFTASTLIYRASTGNLEVTP